MTTESNVAAVSDDRKRRRKKTLVVCALTALAILAVLIVIAVVLALTVFKPKHPTTELVSASVDGVSPRVTLPVVKIEFNISLALKLEVQNRNHAEFRHGLGKSLVLYRGNQVGEADVYPGTIPAMGNATVDCRLTVQVDELAGDVADLIRDVLGGQVVMETRTTIPGKVTFLGIFKKHVVTTSDCQLTIGVMNLKVRSQNCKYKTQL